MNLSTRCRRRVSGIGTPLDGVPTGASGIRISHGCTKSTPIQIQNPKSPSLKVLEILKNFFQEVFKQGLGQSPKVFPSLYPIGIKGDQASLQVMPSELAEV